MRFTHEGATGVELTTEQELRRSVLSCLLWEDTFYESGEQIKNRIERLATEVAKSDPKLIASLAIEAREKFKLRSVPLLLVKTLAANQKGSLVGKTLTRVIQRPDEMVDFLKLYWEGGKKPLSAQVKEGLANSFNKFDLYQMAKWDTDDRIRFRDIMFLTHPIPKDQYHVDLFKKLADKTMPTADTWESRLSNKELNKKQSWEELLTHNKMGALAVIRNLRNFQRDSVDPDIIRQALREMKVERVLPYRFITAERYASSYSKELEDAMFRCLKNHTKLPGKTVILVDVSGSMEDELGSGRRTRNYWTQDAVPTTSRLDVACGTALLLREICDDVEIYTFSNKTLKVESARGFELRNKILRSQPHSGTYLGRTLKSFQEWNVKYDRLVIFTDEQSHDDISFYKNSGKGYIVNVAPYKNGIGYGKEWIHIDGFSEAVIDWIQQYELEIGNGWKPTILEILFSGLF